MNASDSAKAAPRWTGLLAKVEPLRRFGLALPVLLGVMMLAALALAPSGAAAAPPEALWTRCTDDSEADTQCSVSRGVAAAPTSAGPGVAGNVFVADSVGFRIVELTAWGQFVRTFGWGVVASGPDDKPQNEIQEVTVDATAGDFKLRLSNVSSGRNSASIPFDATATAVQAALEAVGPPGGQSIGVNPGDVTVSGPAGGPWTIEFIGALADTDIRQLEVTETTLSGGAGATVATTQGGANFEVCVPADGDTCRAGQEGAAAGQFRIAQGIAVDSSGDVYVADRGELSNPNLRIQKFDAEGNFLLTIGGKVDKTKVQKREEQEANSEPVTVTEQEENLCTAASGDECGKGIEGTGHGQFTAWPVSSQIAVGPADTLYVGDKERVQAFKPDGTFKSQFALPGKGYVASLAVDQASGNLYAGFASEAGGFSPSPDVRKLSPLGAELATIAVADPRALATDAAGELFAVDGGTNPTIRQFTPAGAEVPSFAFKDGFNSSTGIAIGSACLSSGNDLYVSNAAVAPNGFLRAYGPAPDEAHQALCPPPPHAPEIVEQATLSVETERATVQASINPKFWADTSYFVQYAGAACIEEGGWEAPCVLQEPASTASLGAGATDAPAKTAQVSLTGLTPASEYTYRFVSTSSGGGPVYGKGGTEAAEGKASLFTTTPPAFSPSSESCPNQVFRSGSSAFLPDCRAYELVSPVDKNGGDIQKTTGAFIQASPEGDRITYTTPPAFGDQPSGKLQNQYLASREEGVGWSTHGINPPLGRQLEESVFLHVGNDAEAFSADLCSEWLLDHNTTPLAPGAQEGYVNLYRRDLCGGGGFEALSTATPTSGARPVTYMEPGSVQGIAASGDTFFVAEAGLTPDAVPGDTKHQIYVSSGGAIHLVSVLRSGAADPGEHSGAVVGAGIEASGGEGNLEDAVSADGSRVYWTSGIEFSPTAERGGRLYLRENPTQPQSAVEHGGATGTGDLSLAGTTVANLTTHFGEFAAGQTIVGPGIPAETTILAVNGAEHKLTLSAAASASQAGAKLEAFSECTEADKACTVAVSDGNKPIFWDANPSGSEAVYSDGSVENGAEKSDATFYRFNADSKTSTPLADHFKGMLGASKDLSRIYFVSTDVLTGNQKNGEGEVAQAGEPNLYLEEEGTLTFIATLLGGKDGDLFSQRGDGAVYNVATFNPHYRTARVTPDGAHVVFQSRAPLAGYDNIDLHSGEPVVEVYAYEAGGALHCVSCNPSGARPDGRELNTVSGDPSTGHVWGAAWIPGAGQALHASNVLSKDGKRIFFNSTDGWLAQDTNGAQDVYEWEAPGAGRCTAESHSFHKANGGCVYLISSGESPSPSEFWEASADGRDVFFTTAASLLPQDPAHFDLYDARVDGGFPQPIPPPDCEGEACQSAPAPPADQTLSSASFKGAGNPKQGSGHKPRCAKGKRQVRRGGKTRCVAKHKRSAHKRNANHNRRTAR